ncbi:hypothetical protein [Mycobacterium sp.]|uniref:hypothetical protein n=1 Tax=Mycobacterium sp. TaxID=1785 RepID=UPI001280D271|nr:hypothetical protein [Mycobacterium sp.]KAA8962922.1 MAG: hypothetical protein F6Q13_11405 [Mycobacterium sp.]
MADNDGDAHTTTAELSAEGEPKNARGKSRLKLPGAADRKPPWLTLTTLVIALIAVGVAVAAWFRPTHSATPRFSDQQAAEAKKSMCTAYTSVHEGVVSNTHMANPNPNDPVGQLAVAANARLALMGGGEYLRQRLAAAPATPAELSNAVASMANTLEDLAIGYLSGATNFSLDPLRRDLDNEIGQIDALCA